jgi:hypothetical protein
MYSIGLKQQPHTQKQMHDLSVAKAKGGGGGDAPGVKLGHANGVAQILNRFSSLFMPVGPSTAVYGTQQSQHYSHLVKFVLSLGGACR